MRKSLGTVRTVRAEPTPGRSRGLLESSTPCPPSMILPRYANLSRIDDTLLEEPAELAFRASEPLGRVVPPRVPFCDACSTTSPGNNAPDIIIFRPITASLKPFRKLQCAVDDRAATLG